MVSWNSTLTGTSISIIEVLLYGNTVLPGLSVRGKKKINLKTISVKEWGDNPPMNLLRPGLMAFLAFLVKYIKPTVLVLYTVH